MITFDEVLSKLVESSKISREELLKKIDEKQKSLSGLVSPEGAALLVARELGFDFEKNNNKVLKIKDLFSGMRSANAIGRVFRLSPVIEFQRSDGSKGKVVNLFIGDSSGYVRFPLWNDQVKLVEENEISLGDVIQISNSYVKENIYGGIEISLGKFGNVSVIEDTGEITSTENLDRKFFSSIPERCKIADLVPGKFEISGTLVQVFKGNFIFKKEEESALVVSCMLDDGSGNIRTVFFRDQAQKLLEISAEEIEKLDLDKRYELIREKLLGKEVQLMGRVRKNNVFDRIEFIVDEIKSLNVLDESKRLAETVETKLGA